MGVSINAGIMIFIVSAILTLPTKLASVVPPAYTQEKFFAYLTGNSEIPHPVLGKSIGVVVLKFYGNMNMLDYVINLTNVQNVIMVHIHEGDATEVGPVILNLYNGSTPVTAAYNATGQLYSFLISGNATKDDLEGPLLKERLSDLLNLINDGRAYINVHTIDYPNGQMRGMILR